MLLRVRLLRAALSRLARAAARDEPARAARLDAWLDALAPACDGDSRAEARFRQAASTVAPVLAQGALAALARARSGSGSRAARRSRRCPPPPRARATRAAAALARGALNGAAVLALVAACTCAFARLFAAGRARATHLLLCAAFALPPAALALRLAAAAARALALPARGGELDAATAAVLAWNVSVGLRLEQGVLYRAEHRWAALSNACLQFSSLAVGWIFLCFDEPTLWLTLGALVAVGLVRGPRAVRPAPADRRGAGAAALISPSRAELPAGLLYETPSGFSLGSGDLLFYGVVIGRGGDARPRVRGGRGARRRRRRVPHGRLGDRRSRGPRSPRCRARSRSAPRATSPCRRCSPRSSARARRRWTWCSSAAAAGGIRRWRVRAQTRNVCPHQPRELSELANPFDDPVRFRSAPLSPRRIRRRQGRSYRVRAMRSITCAFGPLVLRCAFCRARAGDSLGRLSERAARRTGDAIARRLRRLRAADHRSC